MRRDEFDKAGEEFAEDIVEEIPATPAGIAAELPDDVETFVEERPELPEAVDAFEAALPEEVTDSVEDTNDMTDYLSVSLPVQLSEELD